MDDKKIELIYYGRVTINHNDRYAINSSNIIFNDSKLSEKLEEAFGVEGLGPVEIEVTIRAK